MVAKMGKRLKKANEAVDKAKQYSLDEAVKLVKSNSTAKFDETIEVSMNLNVDPRHADQQVRGVTNLPNGTGKEVRVAVIARDAKADEAKKAGADIVGAEDLIEEIQKSGKVDFDICIASPDMMALVGRIGKILGPKGVMPNPKLGTVTPDVAKAVESSKSGQVQFRVEKAGIVQAGVGKASFSADAILENVKTFIDAVLKAKPSGVKGSYLKGISLSSTMGPGLKLDIQSL